MKPVHVVTPLWESVPLTAAAGTPVHLKMEALQPAGSFKTRGMGAACMAAYDAGTRRVVCASGGNAGYAVAHAGRQLGMGVTIVVPESTSGRARELIAGEGAAVLVHGASWDDANQHAHALAVQQDAVVIHPFDDPVVWRGHAGMIGEVAAAGFKPGMVVVSVGGGGLLCGVVEGLWAQGWADVPVLAVETRGADAFARSLAAGRLVTLPAITSVATSLGARRVTATALKRAAQHPVIPWVIEDAMAVRACLRFSDDHRLLVEPACGAALAAAYEPAPSLSGHGPVLIVACGGVGVTRSLLARWERDLLPGPA